MSDDLDIRSLLEKLYHEGLSPSEKRVLDRFLETEDGEKQLHAFMEEKALEAFDDSTPIDAGYSSEMLDRLQSGIREGNEVRARHARRWFVSYPVVKIAAAFAGIVFLVVAGMFAYQKHQIVTHITDVGERETIILPDLSTVTLHGNSSLTYKRDLQDGALRAVVLRGEAYFSVTKRKHKPFIVHAGGVEIRVLGTTFMVKSYDEDESVEASLIEGRIAVRGRDDVAENEVILSPNQKATFSKSSQKITLSQVTPDVYASNESKKLVFESERFGEIVKTLERKYGVRIDVEDPASRDCRFSATIQYESLKEVLDLFAATTDLSYRISGKAIKVTGRLCN